VRRLAEDADQPGAVIGGYGAVPLAQRSTGGWMGMPKCLASMRR
jgi:hypothetical protein